MEPLYLAANWSPMTWALMFSCMAVAILAVFVTFVAVLVRESRATPPPRQVPQPTAPTVVPSEQGPDEHHLHAA